MKAKCRWCKKGGKLKAYIIADNLEEPKHYHPKCYDKLIMEVMIKMGAENVKDL